MEDILLVNVHVHHVIQRLNILGHEVLNGVNFMIDEVLHAVHIAGKTANAIVNGDNIGF